MGRTSGYRKTNYSYQADPYLHGNAAPKLRPLHTAPARRESQEERIAPRVSKNARKNRAKALRINMGYVLFLTAAAVASLFVCVNYLQLQAVSTTNRKTIASLEGELSTAKLANDTEYERTASSVDLEQIKEIAINKLGMVYANEGQIVTYNSQEGDYLRQYEDVPTK